VEPPVVEALVEPPTAELPPAPDDAPLAAPPTLLTEVEPPVVEALVEPPTAELPPAPRDAPLSEEQPKLPMAALRTNTNAQVLPLNRMGSAFQGGGKRPTSRVSSAIRGIKRGLLSQADA
jgi:hypothetical protein